MCVDDTVIMLSDIEPSCIPSGLEQAVLMSNTQTNNSQPKQVKILQFRKQKASLKPISSPEPARIYGQRDRNATKRNAASGNEIGLKYKLSYSERMRKHKFSKSNADAGTSAFKYSKKNKSRRQKVK